MIYIVSGLPRSGTSMVMKMIEAGGLDILTDHLRKPDTDNPKGYCEYEPVKALAKNAQWVYDVDEKGIKVISHLLPYLPADLEYKVLFVLRPIEEILASQAKMLERRGEPIDGRAEPALARKFRDHLYSVRLWIARQAHMECLFLKYGDIIAAPLEKAVQIAAFLGRPCDVEAMASVVDSRLYRNKLPGHAKT